MERERKSSGNSFKEKFEKLRTYGGWKALAPALVCLVLVVGVFSSGLFEDWLNSDEIIQTPSVQTQTPVAEETTTSSPEDKAPTVVIAPKKDTSTVNTEIKESAPTEHQDEVTDDIASEPAPASEPMLISEPVEQAPMTMPGRTVMNPANIISVDSIENFLNNTDMGFDLNGCVADIQASTLLPGLSNDAVVLSLNPEQWTKLLEYTNSNNISVQQAQQNESQREILVVITECEE